MTVHPADYLSAARCAGLTHLFLCNTGLYPKRSPPVLYSDIDSISVPKASAACNDTIGIILPGH